MKKIIKSLPDDWVYQLISLSLITTFTFYFFKQFEDYAFMKDFWKQNEKFYIYTFLFMQFVVKAVFYWGIYHLINKQIAEKIKKKYYDSMRKPKSIGELKDLNELRKILIEAFGIPIKVGLIEREDLQEKIELTENELVVSMRNTTKWVCITIHVVAVSLIVWNLSAYYIIPLLILFFLIILAYWYAISFVYGNIELIDKVRVDLLEKEKDINKPAIS